MNIEKEAYHGNKDKIVDFERKRFKFWLETVPKDIRHLEYELWRCWRRLHHLKSYQFENHIKIGRHNVIPPFTSDIDKQTWELFRSSFLKGKERHDRLQYIINQSINDFPKIFSGIPSETLEKIVLVALTGSSVYGPRRKGEILSDVDIHFLIDGKDASLNFEKMPGQFDDIPYHIIGTGKSDAARGSRGQIHWLLYPHIPLENKLSHDRLIEIIDLLIEDTRKRQPEIQKYIKSLEVKIKDLSEGVIY
ncbi:MAG: hypothetical protein A3G02_00295 [Candidatus Yanofskybacteria bacterium RIFCSPLOWO2_12_FULL_44_13b]|uniref:Uncharacterized protein n=2 Tax=Candidatus Yanofskyibacteriota TaxID=1752733 RepID=A0A1F8H190_9BACT|nr:MAG: hypothetical protein UW14_C0013G0020 [Candidatus Yanofskybacteria bacterium GW2011_GWA2_44_10]KKT90390.1 MAG: hypothetical protein UW90_C0002G0039 [Candidatus Yanofskybacteria bacterium GW2011_GWB1_45_11]OGN02974.1 MAG: hypothetical protein A2657_01140 [Candidatus Yanofskybacteria bacterium RIFCSPHIGHO2_01_FULL_44_110b]OGN15186.1 MAG: hypothetical protein A3C01_01965 [Candidatus Yanofskybacteria bacterium RIFCSPHIGHO2_02_FULL_44_36b]OGN18464.1 MAG: hypothetical protein A3F50_01555 [Cand